MKILFSVIIICNFVSCESFEIRGLFTSYENANQRFLQSQEWNKSHDFSKISVEKEDYSIFIIADTHIGETVNFEKFLQDAMNADVAAAVLNGDITNGHEKDFEKLASKLPTFETLPYFYLAGNHELYFNGWKHFQALFGTGTYYFTIKTPTAEDLFICLDTSGGTLGNLQLNWFKNLLESKRNNYRHCVIFTHNNILRHRATMSTNLMLEEIHVFMDLVVRHEILYIVNGHDHIRNVKTLGNSTYLVMDASFDEFNKASYVKLNFSENKQGYEFVQFN